MDSLSSSGLISLRLESVKRRKRKEKEGRRKKRKKGTKNRWGKWKTNNNMVDLNLTISIITSNINSLNIPIKRQRLSVWIKKQDQLYVEYEKSTLNKTTQLN